jgi:hypothetical protein
MKSLPPQQAKAERRTFPRAVVGTPTAVVVAGGTRMLFLPILDSVPVTLFTEAGR